MRLVSQSGHQHLGIATPQPQNLHAEFEELSRRLLLTARDLAAFSPAEASMRTGLSPSDVVKLRDLNVPQCEDLAKSGRVMFSLRLPTFSSQHRV